MENKRFMITIYIYLFALGLEAYSMNIQDLRNLYKISMVCSFCPYVFLIALGLKEFTMDVQDLSNL